jgi:hypothetical protein
MKIKVWSGFAVVASTIVWLWAMIALPSLRGFDGPYASSARGIVLGAFTVLAITSVISGVLLLRRSRR